MSRSEREELRLLHEIVELLEDIKALLTPQSTTAVLSTQGDLMATTATLTFVDSTGAPAAPPKGDGSGLSIAFASDNAAVTLCPVTPSGDTATATITGTEAFNLSATVSNVSGAALLDDDGVTAFVQPAPLAVPAGAAPQAVTAVLTAT
jgi:hypothetical protein